MTVGNPTDQNKTIHLDWKDLTALENGTYRDSTITERLDRSAAPHLLVSPARFHLRPGEQRQIEISVRSETHLPEKVEKRSHLVVHLTDNNGPLRKVDTGLHLDMARAVSVPVILRSEETHLLDNSVQIGDAKLRRLADGGLALDVLLERIGPHSVYGKLRVEGALFAGGKFQTLHEQDNIALYTENENRTVSFPLGIQELPESTLSVLFTGSGEYSGSISAKRLFAVEAQSKTNVKGLKD